MRKAAVDVRGHSKSFTYILPVNITVTFRWNVNEK